MSQDFAEKVEIYIAAIGAAKTVEELDQLQKELDELAKSEIDTKVYADYNEQYQGFVLLALLILIADFFIFNRKNKALSRLDIFNEKWNEY